MKGPSLTTAGSGESTYGIALAYNNIRTLWSFNFKTEMRANQTVSMSNLAYLQGLGVVGGWNAAPSIVHLCHPRLSSVAGSEKIEVNVSDIDYECEIFVQHA